MRPGVAGLRNLAAAGRPAAAAHRGTGRGEVPWRPPAGRLAGGFPPAPSNGAPTSAVWTSFFEPFDVPKGGIPPRAPLAVRRADSHRSATSGEPEKGLSVQNKFAHHEP